MTAVTIPREQLAALVELAEDSLYTQETEFSNPPTDEDRMLMCFVWEALGKEVPPWFARKGWRIDSEVKPDEREDRQRD